MSSRSFKKNFHMYAMDVKNPRKVKKFLAAGGDPNDVPNCSSSLRVSSFEAMKKRH